MPKKSESKKVQNNLEQVKSVKFDESQESGVSAVQKKETHPLPSLWSKILNQKNDKDTNLNVSNIISDRPSSTSQIPLHELIQNAKKFSQKNLTKY